MLIKEAEYKEEQVMRRKCVKEAVYGCDNCRSEINEYPNEDSRLEVTVFHQSNDEDKTEHLHFCSWECVFEYLKTVTTDYFVSLPYMYFEDGNKGKRSGTHLQELLKERWK